MPAAAAGRIGIRDPTPQQIVDGGDERCLPRLQSGKGDRMHQVHIRWGSDQPVIPGPGERGPRKYRAVQRMAEFDHGVSLPLRPPAGRQQEIRGIRRVGQGQGIKTLKEAEHVRAYPTRRRAPELLGQDQDPQPVRWTVHWAASRLAAASR